MNVFHTFLLVYIAITRRVIYSYTNIRKYILGYAVIISLCSLRTILLCESINHKHYDEDNMIMGTLRMEPL